MLLKSKAFALDLYQVGDDVDQIKVQIQRASGVWTAFFQNICWWRLNSQNASSTWSAAPFLSLFADKVFCF